MENGWSEVRYNKKTRGKWDDMGRGKGKPSGDSTSFFITEFPERMRAKDLYKVFADYGEVDEVFIPQKRDRNGRRYGFVRFFGVEDTRRLCLKLDSIFLEGRKMFANVPRFEKMNKGGREKEEYANRSSWKKEEFRGKNEEFRGKKGSQEGYRQNKGVYKGAHSKVSDSTYAGVVSRDAKEGVLKFEVKKEEMERFSAAYVGRVASPGMTYNIQRHFNSEGYFGVKVTPLGANLCLLEENEKGEIEELISTAKSWLDQWFVEVRRWRQEDMDPERITWVRLYGIPCHAWNGEFLLFCHQISILISMR